MKKFIAIILSIILIFVIGITAYGATIEYKDKDGKTQKIDDFLDTKGHWAHDVILKWADYQLVLGNNGYFMPDSSIKRGDLCVILDRMLCLESIAYNYFYDLSNDTYYTDAVLKCVAAGYITGTGATTVDAGGNATREQVAVIIYRMFNLDSAGYNNIRKFNDDYQIGSWAREAVYTMRKYGYMNGNGNNNFNPKANITRAEFVQVLNNIAGSYIPKNDKTGQGNTFKTSFESNLMTSKNIELVNSSVAKDMTLTFACSTLIMTNTTIGNRLFVMDKTNITLNNCVIDEIYLNSGKSILSGITKDINSIYVSVEASESTIDVVPKKIILEPGARIKINTKFYENTSLKTQIYYGADINEALSSEQGFVVGGPKITGTKISQSYSNKISGSNIRVTVGNNNITEIGVLWRNKKSNESPIIPTYSNKTGYKKYEVKDFTQLLVFDDIDTVKDTRIYRVYAKDSEGLYAYSDAFIFSEYGFDITMSLFDVSYPSKIGAEIVFSGENIPKVKFVKCIYDKDGNYSATHRQYYMTKFTVDGESNDKQYMRYTSQISSDYYYQGNEIIYQPYTTFGYSIVFDDDSEITLFPVITDGIPKGVVPIKALNIGIASYGQNQIIVQNNKLMTSYVEVQEVGILYKESIDTNVDAPDSNLIGWSNLVCGHNIKIDSSYSFNAAIPITDENKFTHYCLYVRTANGYYFGDVFSISNNNKGDEDGYIINKVETTIFDSDVLFKIYYEGNSLMDGSSIVSFGSGLQDKQLYLLENSVDKNYCYFVLRNLDENAVYNMMLRITKSNGSRSNIYPVIINMKTQNINMSVSNKMTLDNQYTLFTLNSEKPLSYYTWKNFRTVNSDAEIKLKNSNTLMIPYIIDTTEESIIAVFDISVGSKTFTFSRTFKLY